MGQCLFPIELKNYEATVPCGRCYECRVRYASNWSWRLMQEAKHANSAYFITLTYDSQGIPRSPNGYAQLRKRDLQLFFKRLRRAHNGYSSGKRIKYYAVGEYGTKTKRPHYHIILFNAELLCLTTGRGKKIIELNKYDGASPVDCLQWYHEETGEMLGHMTVGLVSGASVGYTMKYIVKPKQIPMHRNDDRQPEFACISKGMGLSYLTEKNVSWHFQDMEKRMYVNCGNGKKASMPRYIKEKMYYDHEKRDIGESNRTEFVRKLPEVIPWKYKEEVHNYQQYQQESLNQLFIYATRGRDKL